MFTVRDTSFSRNLWLSKTSSYTNYSAACLILLLHPKSTWLGGDIVNLVVQKSYTIFTGVVFLLAIAFIGHFMKMNSLQVYHLLYCIWCVVFWHSCYTCAWCKMFVDLNVLNIWMCFVLLIVYIVLLLLLLYSNFFSIMKRMSYFLFGKWWFQGCVCVLELVIIRSFGSLMDSECNVSP